MKNVPVDKRLYNTVVQEAKDRFLVWPSAYASGWVVKTYKARGGTYYSPTLTRNGYKERPLQRWYNQNWVDVCYFLETGIKRPCGRRNASWQEYPYCRPEKRLSTDTPKTLDQVVRTHGRKKLGQLCRRKKQNPSNRITLTPL